MKGLNKGEFYGDHFQYSEFDDYVITDTLYTHPKVDWHLHENAYFTYLIEGKLFEANKKEEYFLESGSLVFHNWQDAHYNRKDTSYTRGFHLELHSKWFDKYGLLKEQCEGSLRIENPVVKSLMNKIFIESKAQDENSQISIDMLLLEIFSLIHECDTIQQKQNPAWVIKLKDLITETNSDFSLTSLSKEMNVHPVHLSRAFHKYFGTTLSQYLRQQKLNKAVMMIVANKLSLTEIGYACGFYDQSHFISKFKSIYQLTPSKFSKKILQG